MLSQIFFSPKVKRSVIIGNRHGIYELPNGIRLRILGNKEISRKSQNFLDSNLVFLSNRKLSILRKKFEKQKLNFSPSALFHMKTRVCLKHFLHDCIWRQLFASNSPQPPLNVISVTVLGTPRLLTQFYAKIRAILITTFPIFSRRSKFDIENLSSLVWVVFAER